MFFYIAARKTSTICKISKFFKEPCHILEKRTVSPTSKKGTIFSFLR